jgi:DNA-binding response OmpR family regulator
MKRQVNKLMTVAPKTVLIAEDEERINNLICARLKQEGYQVIQTFDGREALQDLLQGKADLALLNMMMPHLDGSQILKRLRKVGIAIPIIIFSVKSWESEMRTCLYLGAKDYMVKPFELNDMVSRVNKMIREL